MWCALGLRQYEVNFCYYSLSLSLALSLSLSFSLSLSQQIQSELERERGGGGREGEGEGERKREAAHQDSMMVIIDSQNTKWNATSGRSCIPLSENTYDLSHTVVHIITLGNAFVFFFFFRFIIISFKFFQNFKKWKLAVFNRQIIATNSSSNDLCELMAGICWRNVQKALIPNFVLLFVCRTDVFRVKLFRVWLPERHHVSREHVKK